MNYTPTFSRQNLGIGSWPMRRARQIPQRIAWSHEGNDTTFAEVERRVDRLAAGLTELGVQPGDRVAYVGANHPAMLETLFAVARAGALAVLVNPRLSFDEVRFILSDSGARVVMRGESVTSGEPLLGHDTLTELAHAVSVGGASGDPLAFEDLLASSAPSVDVPAGWDDPCLIMYTSGTTGRPKGAVLSHGNIFFNDMNTLMDTDLRPDDVALVAAPMFHIAMLNGTVMPVFLKGGRSVIHSAFDAGTVLAALRDEGVTSMFAVPAMMDLIAQHPDFERSDLSSLRSVIVGGAPIPMRTLTQWGERGVQIQQGYGLTETAPAVLKLGAEDAYRKIGSAGTPQMLVDVRIVDERGEDVPVGTAGEIITRPNVFLGYWGREAATRDAFIDGGWFRTGDVGVQDDEGYITLKDRQKDMYISGGENVYPAEVESALLDIDGVLEAAVVGVPDERWGEVGKAYLVLREGVELNLEQVQASLAGHLARYKFPHRLAVIDALPRTSTGKLQKHVLRGVDHGEETVA